MRQVRVSLLWVVDMSVVGSAQAQVAQGTVGGGSGNEPGWHVSVEFMNILTRGNDVHVGDVFTEHQTISGTAASSRLDYGVDYEQIVTRMKNDQSALFTAGYRGASWGFGARGWKATTEGTVDGTEQSPAPTSTSLSITGVRMWDNSIIPVADMEDPSGISPVTFSAENKLEALRLEGFVERRWLGGPDLNVAVRIGLAHARIENTRSEGQTQHAFIEEVGAGSTSTLENDIALDGESEATMNLTGPVLAIVGDSTFRKVRLDWLLSHSAMIGTAETTGTWTDVDDITEVVVAGATRTETLTLLSGTLPIEREERALVPVLEAQFRVGVLVTRNVSVGAGVFSSTWFKMPVAPAFSIPDDWTDVQGAGWRQQTRDISFTGFTLFAAFGF